MLFCRFASVVFVVVVVAVGCPAPPPCDSFAGDNDGDGICDAFDNCVADDNANQEDVDDDGIGDACDNSVGSRACEGQGGDDDDDNVCGLFDNCRDIGNDDQADIDDDGIGDACDIDDCDGIDNDGNGTVDDNAPDSDNDGVGDCVDVCFGGPDVDSDDDGVVDCADTCPRDRQNDIDGDGRCADVDNCPSLFNPDFSSPGQADTDRDGVGDACEVEVCDGLDNNGNGSTDEGFPDDDGDSVCDDADLCPGESINDEDADGLCGSVDNCPTIANTDQADADVDGVGDACDLDASDNCDGTADVVDQAIPAGLVIRGLAGDLESETVYVSSTSTSAALANRVLAIDGSTGRLMWSVLVGSEPGQLALSDDGRSLYVAVNGSATVRLVDTINRRACGSFGVHGEDTFFGPTFVGDMDVMPGHAETVVISGAYSGVSPDYAGTFVYDAGQRRRNGTSGHTGARLVVVASETEAYGFNSLSTEFGFRRLRIDASGIREEEVVEGLIDGFNVGGIVLAGDRVYGGNIAVDVGRMVRAGSFPADGPVAVDNAAAEAFFVQVDKVRVFDTESFLFLRDFDLPISVRGEGFGFGVLIVRFGERGIAIADENAVVFFADAVSP